MIHRWTSMDLLETSPVQTTSYMRYNLQPEPLYPARGLYAHRRGAYAFLWFNIKPAQFYCGDVADRSRSGPTRIHSGWWPTHSQYSSSSPGIYILEICSAYHQLTVQETPKRKESLPYRSVPPPLEASDGPKRPRHAFLARGNDSLRASDSSWVSWWQ